MNVFSEQNFAWNRSYQKMCVHSSEFQEQSTVHYCNRPHNNN